MAGGWIVRRLAAVVLVALVWSIALAGAAHAQGTDELARLRSEVSRLHGQGKYADAIPIAERYVALARQKHGEEHADFALALDWLASVYRAQGRNTEAERLYTRALSIRERVLGIDHPDVGSSLNNLAELFRALGRYGEAEALYRRSISVLEKALGSQHPRVGTTLNNLALVYWARGRYGEAEPLYKRGIGIVVSALGPGYPEVGTAVNNLAALYRSQKRYAEAEVFYKHSLFISERTLGADHPSVGTTLSNLALLYEVQGHHAEAAKLYDRSLTILEKALGPAHPDLAIPLNNLADLLHHDGYTDLAEPLYRRSLDIIETVLGFDHIYAVFPLNNMARLAYFRGNWTAAADYWRRSTGITTRRSMRDPAETFGREAHRFDSQFWGLVKTTAKQNPTTAMGAQMFETAQWGRDSDAAASLAQMAARSAKGSLAALVRERQDLVSEWHGKDKLLIASKSEAPPKRNAVAEKALSQRLAAIDMRLAAIDARLAKDFPDYAALVSPAPVSVADVQAQLGTDEALVLFLDTPAWAPMPEETFVWVITKSHVRWVRSDLGTAALTRDVGALRCGFDGGAWDGAGAKSCTDALQLAAPGKTPNPLPFSHARAHKLYTALFGQVHDLIKGKRLLIVPSGPLTQLPFQVLVTKPPVSADHRAAAGLARDHAITVLPAVSSLKALRRVGRPRGAVVGLVPAVLHPLPDVSVYVVKTPQVGCEAVHWHRLPPVLALGAAAVCTGAVVVGLAGRDR
jgi:tetratricopeptide (TPR) repeat protein